MQCNVCQSVQGQGTEVGMLDTAAFCGRKAVAREIFELSVTNFEVKFYQRFFREKRQIAQIREFMTAVTSPNLTIETRGHRVTALLTQICYSIQMLLSH